MGYLDVNLLHPPHWEETQEKEESIHSEVEVVKQQLEAHKVRVTASSSNYSTPAPQECTRLIFSGSTL